MGKEQAVYRCRSFFEKAFVIHKSCHWTCEVEMRSGSVSPSRTLKQQLESSRS